MFSCEAKVVKSTVKVRDRYAPATSLRSLKLASLTFFKFQLSMKFEDTLYKYPENFYRKYNNPKYHCKASRHMEKASTTPRSCGAWIPLYLIPCKNKLTYLGDVGRKNIPLNKVSQWRGGQYRGLYKLRRIYWSWN